MYVVEFHFEAWHTVTIWIVVIITAFAAFIAWIEAGERKLRISDFKNQNNFNMKVDSTQLKESITEVERELQMRQKLYPTWIGKGSLNKVTAERQIRRLNYALELLRALQGDPEAQKAVNEQLKLF